MFGKNISTATLLIAESKSQLESPQVHYNCNYKSGKDRFLPTRNSSKMYPSCNHILLVILIIFTCFGGSSWGYSSGGPETPEICKSMTPGHDGTELQKSPSPYSITLNVREVRGSQKVSVNLRSNEPFKGFYSQGRKVGDKGEIPWGKFTLPDKNDGKLLHCSKMRNSTVTHTNNREKNQVRLEWEAPNEDGEFIIYTTFVKDYEDYWIKVPSEKIRVTKDSSLISAPEPPPVEKLSSRIKAKLTEIHSGCGSTKGCFGEPSSCVKDGRFDDSNPCELMTTHKVEGERYIFEVYGKSTGYVGSGLSFDNKMGGDSIVGCINNNGHFDIRKSYNIDTSMGNVFSKNPLDGISSPSPDGIIEDGFIICTFTRNRSITIPELPSPNVFDLQASNYHLIMAKSDGTSERGLPQHGGSSLDRAVIADATHLTNYIIHGSKSTIFIKLHGTFMMIAWLLCASTGMFTARYFKQTHTGFNPMGKAFWFALHTGCMLMTAVLSFIGAFFIFWEIGEYSKDTGSDSHPILGIIANSLAFCQILIAMFRCGPQDPKRPIFNWLHWSIGNSAHIIAIATIFVAQSLHKTGLEKKDEYTWVLTAFVLFHVLMHITMSLHTGVTDRKMEVSDKKRGVRPGPMKSTGLSNEAPGSGFRTFMLVAYLLGTATTCIIIMVIFLNAI